jgi:phenylalanine-4-hydroxylase
LLPNSATTKHGLAAGDAGRPESPDWTIPQGWERYTNHAELEHNYN